MTNFERFKKEIRWWVKELGMATWEVNFQFGINKEGFDGLCEWDYPAQWVIFSLKRGKLSQTPEQIAQHEICELLLAECWNVAENHESSEDSIYASRHRVINIVMRLMKHYPRNGNALRAD